MKKAAAFVIALTLAGCGIDGPPSKPAAAPSSDTQVTISGQASIGVVGRL